MTAALILAALLRLAPSYLDRAETPEQRAELLTPVAEAIAAVAHTPADAALLIALGNHETHFTRAVLEGRCSELGRRACDSGRARGAWQLHLAACPAAYAFEAGSVASLQAEADCAIRQLHYARHRCALRNDSVIAGAFSGYAGASCTARWATARAETYRNVLAGLGAS